MKRLIALCCLILSTVFIFAGCTGDIARDAIGKGTDEHDSYSEVKTEDAGKFVEQNAEEENKWDKIPMVMVDGKLYYDTGNESAIDGRCGNMDGEIISTVDGSETPTENDQSNFGTGFGYQYGTEDTIEIFINEKWIVFEHRSGSGEQIKFGDKMIDADSLSEQTIEWLDWYNSLSQ